MELDRPNTKPSLAMALPASTRLAVLGVEVVTGGPSPRGANGCFISRGPSSARRRPRVPLARFAGFQISRFPPRPAAAVRDAPRPTRFQIVRWSCPKSHASQRVGSGDQGRNRTIDTRIFRRRPRFGASKPKTGKGFPVVRPNRPARPSLSRTGKSVPDRTAR